MAVTETIQEILQGIDDAQYGRDMRQYIHKGIQKCYEEGSAGETDLEARERLDDVEATLTESLTEMQETLEEGLASGFANIAPTESTTTASQAYAVGDYLMYDGKLYKVTTAIISGGAIEVGTNVVESTIAESMQKADSTGTMQNQSFEPSSSSTGTKNGTKIYLEKGVYLVRVACTAIHTGSHVAIFRGVIKDGTASEDLFFEKELNNNTNNSYHEVEIFEIQESGSYIYPRIVQSSGVNYTILAMGLRVVKLG